MVHNLTILIQGRLPQARRWYEKPLLGTNPCQESLGDDHVPGELFPIRRLHRPLAGYWGPRVDLDLFAKPDMRVDTKPAHV